MGLLIQVGLPREALHSLSHLPVCAFLSMRLLSVCAVVALRTWVSLDLVFPLIGSLGNNSKTKYGCSSESTQLLKNTYGENPKGYKIERHSSLNLFIFEATVVSIFVYIQKS